jgi:hypothetical protein
MRGTIVAGALGNCVHVAGVAGFLNIAEQLGYRTVFLGAAVPIDVFVEAVREHDADIVGVSYRLTPDVGGRLVGELKSSLERSGLLDRRFVFGGTPPVCEAVRELDWFERCFSGLESPDVVWSYLRGETKTSAAESFGDTLVERLNEKSPYPILRHHFGLPDLEATISGVQRIAESGTLDVISIAPDQNAQESFFRTQEMDPALDGAGGVPVRTAADLRRIYQASLCGNYPLLRIYSGTRDLIKWAELASETINNAWAAIPLCWYSELDGRSDRPVEGAIRENQECMRWNARRGIPVEVNEAHHWSLRDAHDTVSVVMSYLAAYNARLMGVRRYVGQYMFNSPPGMSPDMDLAKILAQIEMVESLHGPDFFSLREVRAGLLHLSPQMNKAKGQLAASTMLALTVAPHIIHVVGYCEGDHAAEAEDVIESCEIVHGVLKNCHTGLRGLIGSAEVNARKKCLLEEAELLLNAIRDLRENDEDPFSSPRVIAGAITRGLLDAPHLKGNPNAKGILQTRIINGAVRPVDPETKNPISEDERLQALLADTRIYEATPLGGA